MIDELVFVVVVDPRKNIDECMSGTNRLLSSSLDSDFRVNLLMSVGGDIAAENKSLVTFFFHQ